MKAIATSIAVVLCLVWNNTTNAKIVGHTIDLWELEQAYDSIEYMLKLETGDFILNYDDFDESRIGDILDNRLGRIEQ